MIFCLFNASLPLRGLTFAFIDMEFLKMLNEIQVFEYKNNQIRTVEKDGEIWFVAKDVCEALEIQNTTQAIQVLDEDERAMFYIGRQGEANIISEQT